MCSYQEQVDHTDNGSARNLIHPCEGEGTWTISVMFPGTHHHQLTLGLSGSQTIFLLGIYSK